MSSVRRLGPASIASPWNSGKLVAALAAAITLTSCNTPTQVTVLVTTDVPCQYWKGAIVSVGTWDSLEEAGIGSSTDNCTETEGGVRIGEIVVVPKDGKNDKFAIKVIGGVDSTAKACLETGDYSGCIVARRTLNFIPHGDIRLPIFLSSSCEGVPCSARKNETCVFGACVSANIPKPELCEDSPQACSDGVLTGADNVPPVQEPVECGRPSVIVDDFATTDPLKQWIIQGGPKEVSQSDGVLVLSPPANGTVDVGLRSAHAVNLDGDAITVKVPAMLNTASESRAYLAAAYDEANQIRIEQKNGMLHFLSTDAAGMLSGPSATYDPKQHLWWEIRATAKNIVLRTSPDGLSWALGASIPRESVAHFMEHANIVLGAGAAGASPGAVSFDHLNLGRPVISWCSLDGAADTFDGASPAPKWRLETTEFCSITQKEQGLFLELTGEDAATCSLRSRNAFDLRGKSIVLNVETIAIAEPSVNFFLSLEDDRGFGAEIGVRVSQEVDLNGQTVFYYVRRPETLAVAQNEVLYNMSHKLLRIREEAGTLYWETSDTGDVWDELFKDAPGFETKAAHVIVRLEAFVPLLTKPLTVKVADLSVGSGASP